MAVQPTRHGTEAGYREELKTDSVCNRCINAHRVYQRQYTRAGKKSGLSYDRHQVIDQLYQGTGQGGYKKGQGPRTAPPAWEPVKEPHNAPTGQEETRPVQDDPERTWQLGDRLGEAIGRITTKFTGNDYVESEDAPDYIHASEADPEPNASDGWSQVAEEDFVITKAGMARIEDNLGTYLSVVGITFEMIDPYCGPVLAENFENIVGKWTKVIARYPRAAKLFLSEEGGTIFTWIGALQATWPVLLAIYKHHLAHTVQVDNQGRIFEVHPSANGNSPTVDATTPPYAYTVD